MTGTDAARSRAAALAREAAELCAIAGKADVTLRVVGSVGVVLHCAAAAEAMARLGRVPKDIDVVCRSRDRARLLELVADREWVADRDVLVATEGTRYCFRRPPDATVLDVFVDRLEFCHTLNLASRLSRHPVTVPVDDLLLQKLQVHAAPRSDLADIAALLSVHHVDEQAGGDGERIDAEYVARLLARDWGFHHTAQLNLERVAEEVARGAFDGLGGGLQTVLDGVERLRAACEREPKTVRWRARARVGERVQWWQDVSNDLGAY